MIRAIIAGNVGRDAQTKPAGQSTVTEFTVASSRKGRDGTESTTWVRCSLWGRRGEALARYLAKGSQVTCCGELTARAYADRNGQPAVGLDMRVDDVALQGAPRTQQAPAYAPQQAPRQYQAAPAPQQAPAPAYAPQAQGYAPQPAPQYDPQAVAQQAAQVADEDIPF